MGSGSEVLGWKNGFRAFHRAKMSSQGTQVNTAGCIFPPKTKLNTLRPYTWAEFHAHAYLPYIKVLIYLFIYLFIYTMFNEGGTISYK